MVASYVELLASRYQGKLDDKADRWIAFAVDAAARMKQLINDLLEFSRVGTRGKPLAPTDRRRRLRDGRDEPAEGDPGERRAGDPAARCRRSMADAQPAGPAVPEPDRQRPQVPGPQRARGAHGQAERQDGCWLFSVRDNGIGIDPQFAERIFVIFQRLHTREQYPGTGIGLAVCKKIVERHGGRIWVESQVGQGATFHFTIPDKREADDGIVQAREAGGDPAGGG